MIDCLIGLRSAAKTRFIFIIQNHFFGASKHMDGSSWADLRQQPVPARSLPTPWRRRRPRDPTNPDYETDSSNAGADNSSAEQIFDTLTLTEQVLALAILLPERVLGSGAFGLQSSRLDCNH